MSSKVKCLNLSLYFQARFNISIQILTNTSYTSEDSKEKISATCLNCLSKKIFSNT